MLNLFMKNVELKAADQDGGRGDGWRRMGKPEEENDRLDFGGLDRCIPYCLMHLPEAP